MKVKSAWLFDVDGVITDPQAKQVVHPQIVPVISKILSRQEPVGFITGRSIDWLEERILPNFSKGLKSNLFVSGEKGGVFGSWDKKGKLLTTVDRALKVPEAAAKEIEDIALNFSDIVFFDKPKKTMVSVEVIDGVPIEKFKEIQPDLNKHITKILKNHKIEEKFKLDSVRLSTDVENKKAGKDLAARRFILWIKENKMVPSKYYAFGDNPSDLQMAQELHNDNCDVTFVFVGEKDLLKSKYGFGVIFPKKHFDKGVIEFISSVDKTMVVGT